jgi:hypothetical protein
VISVGVIFKGGACADDDTAAGRMPDPHSKVAACLICHDPNHKHDPQPQLPLWDPTAPVIVVISYFCKVSTNMPATAIVAVPAVIDERIPSCIPPSSFSFGFRQFDRARFCF